MCRSKQKKRNSRPVKSRGKSKTEREGQGISQSKKKN